MTAPDFAVVGGGVIGLTVAYELAGRGAAVAVLDRQAFGREASWAGAGILPPPGRVVGAHPLDRLRYVSAGMYPDLASALESITGQPVGYVRNGGVERLRHDDSLTRWEADGIACRLVDAAALRLIEPALPHVGRAVHFPHMAQVRNPWLLRALVAALRTLGVQLLPDRGDVRLRDRGVEWRGGSLAAGCVVVAAGAWSQDLLAPLGVALPVAPVRGQMLLYEQSPELRRTFLDGSRYVVPRGDGTVLVGSTEEHAGFDPTPTAAAAAELQAFAGGHVPSLAARTPTRTWAGLRPASADGLPTVGPEPGVRGLAVAAGHFRAGIQTAPATARLLADLLLGTTPVVPPGPYRVGRPPAAPGESAFRS